MKEKKFKLNFTESQAKALLEKKGVIDRLIGGDQSEISPNYCDLVRLYLLVRERKPFTILEFGSGFSTIVMAYALKQNWDDYLAISTPLRYEKPSIVSVETTEIWKDNTCNKIERTGLSDFSKITFSTVYIAEFQGQICHFYDELPDIVPDFVYLDGPDPINVEGNIQGISFKNPRRTVMSGDILKYESTLLPGFFMVIDGRTNNARFLQRMLKRPFEVHYYEDMDITTFELTEPRLGKKNIFGLEAYSGKF